ncbi:hypothetical protein AGMMS49546_04130 [Spirochaetia bacterium]|nr:hypothetical protein AGMMS49546_04130 [Spirochaetia bacterium]
MNLNYKDSIFTALFSSPDKLRELYNAIKGAHYDEKTKISINTLSDVLFLERINDISFTIDNRLVVLLEHQSTVNPNMPLRFLLYIARIYEKIIETKSLYKTKLLPIPRPEFYVLYNGESPLPEESTLKLSAAFTAQDEGTTPPLELSVQVININLGHSRKILEQ